jgi:hypothetical protein
MELACQRTRNRRQIGVSGLEPIGGALVYGVVGNQANNRV